MLLDQIMPTYQFNTVHSTVIHAPSEKIFAAIKETRVSDVPLWNALHQIRSFPGHITSRGKGYFINNDTTIMEQASTRLGFIMLAEDPDLSLVGTNEPEENAEGRRLSGAVGSEEPVDFSREEGEADAVDGFDSAVSFAETYRAQDLGLCGGRIVLANGRRTGLRCRWRGPS